MGGSTTSSGSSSSTTNPWKPTQEPMKAALGVAGDLWAQGVGSQIYPGSTVTPFSQPTQQGLQQGMALAQNPNSIGNTASTAAQGMITSGGINPFMQQAHDNWNPSSSGQMLNSNPFLQQSLDFQSGKIADKVNSAFSGAGRSGSASHAQALADELAGLRFGAASDNYNFERQMQNQAIQGQAGLGEAAQGVLGGAISNASNVEAGQFNNVDRMLQMGQIIENKQGQALQENKQKFDQQNQMPWTQLERFMSIVQPPAQGFASQQGTSTQTQSNPFNPMSLVGAPMALSGRK